VRIRIAGIGNGQNLQKEREEFGKKAGETLLAQQIYQKKTRIVVKNTYSLWFSFSFLVGFRQKEVWQSSVGSGQSAVFSRQFLVDSAQ